MICKTRSSASYSLELDEALGPGNSRGSEIQSPSSNGSWSRKLLFILVKDFPDRASASLFTLELGLPREN